MAQIKVKRGPSSNITSINLEEGELAYTTDSKKLYIGNADIQPNTLLNPDVALTKSDIGLSNVDNTSDVNKPVSNAVQTALNGKANATHTHTSTDISGLGTAATKNTGTASGNIPVLNTSGRLEESILPALAITDTFEVATQAAMLALSAQKGDIAVRSDLNKTFILRETPAATLANWVELRTPTDTVLSVNTKTGAVVLSAADIGAEPTIAGSAVNNFWSGTKTWRDLATDVRASTLAGLSTANTSAITETDSILTAIGKLQAQGNLKAPLANPSLTGTPTAPTPATVDNSTNIATTAYVKAQGYLDANSVIDGGTF